MNFQKYPKFDKKKDPELMTPTGGNNQTPEPPAGATAKDAPIINVNVDNSEIGKAISKGFKELGESLLPKSATPPVDPPKIVETAPPADPPKPEPKKEKSIMDDYADTFGHW